MIERLSSIGETDLAQLAELLIDAVRDNASVGFPADLSEEAARDYWLGVRSEMESGRTVLLGARVGGRLAGTVQLRFSTYPNGRERAEVAKLLVHTSARRRGIATTLMQELETQARRHRRRLLFLDTETESSAERLYAGLGWTRAGTIPDFAYRPDGALRPTSFYYKLIDRSADAD